MQRLCACKNQLSPIYGDQTIADFCLIQTQWQQLPRVEDRQKYAALLIENYYTRYRQLKQQQDRAARRIQHNYRMYRNRSREMNRAALFIQQMYRYIHYIQYIQVLYTIIFLFVDKNPEVSS